MLFIPYCQQLAGDEQMTSFHHSEPFLSKSVLFLSQAPTLTIMVHLVEMVRQAMPEKEKEVRVFIIINLKQMLQLCLFSQAEKTLIRQRKLKWTNDIHTLYFTISKSKLSIIKFIVPIRYHILWRTRYGNYFYEIKENIRNLDDQIYVMCNVVKNIFFNI